MNTTPEMLEDLRSLSLRSFGRKYGVSTRQVDNLRWQYGLKGKPVEEVGDFPSGIPPVLPPEIHIPHTSRVVLTADWHVPHHDAKFAKKMFKVAKYEGADEIVFLGDFLNEEVFFKGGHEQEPDQIPFRVELRKGRDVLEYALEVIGRVKLVSGNHERRSYRLSKGNVGMAELLAMMALSDLKNPLDVSNIEVTDRDYLIIDHPDPEYRWRVTHGVGGSVSTPASAAIRKAEIHLTNVAQGHNHLVGWGQTKNGRYAGMDIGCMLQKEWIAYKVRDTGTFPEWNQGFAIIHNGRPEQFSQRWTDWTKYGL